MYESFYGFSEKPFNLTPDPDYFYMSRGHEETYIHLEYAIAENKGFVVITGEIGSGKTTLINFLLRRLKPDIEIALISHTLVQPKQFIKMLCQEFELSVDGMDKAEMLDVFHNFLLRQFSENKRVVLIIDESQNLPDMTIEEIRMLSNLESEKSHLLQILLLGQPELKHKLQNKSHEQFVQRVTVAWHLDGLTKDEVDKYILHRLRVAGSERMDIFNQAAIDSIYKHSRGIPRLINIFCDAALVYGFADGLKVIGKDTIEEVVRTRNVGGLLFEHKDNVDISNINLTKKEIGKRLNNRIKNIEKRIDLLENMISSFNKGLDIFSSALESFLSSEKKRDETIHDLTHKLKESTESNVNLLREINRLRSKEKSVFHDDTPPF